MSLFRWGSTAIARPLNRQRAVGDRRSDEADLGLAGHGLLLASGRFRMGRPEIYRPEPTPARRRDLDTHRRNRQPVLATDAPPWR